MNDLKVLSSSVLRLSLWIESAMYHVSSIESETESSRDQDNHMCAYIGIRFQCNLGFYPVGVCSTRVSIGTCVFANEYMTSPCGAKYSNE